MKNSTLLLLLTVGFILGDIIQYYWGVNKSLTQLDTIIIYCTFMIVRTIENKDHTILAVKRSDDFRNSGIE